MHYNGQEERPQCRPLVYLHWYLSAFAVPRWGFYMGFTVFAHIPNYSYIFFWNFLPSEAVPNFNSGHSAFRLLQVSEYTVNVFFLHSYVLVCPPNSGTLVPKLWLGTLLECWWIISSTRLFSPSKSHLSDNFYPYFVLLPVCIFFKGLVFSLYIMLNWVTKYIHIFVPHCSMFLFYL